MDTLIKGRRPKNVGENTRDVFSLGEKLQEFFQTRVQSSSYSQNEPLRIKTDGDFNKWYDVEIPVSTDEIRNYIFMEDEENPLLLKVFIEAKKNGLEEKATVFIDTETGTNMEFSEGKDEYRFMVKNGQTRAFKILPEREQAIGEGKADKVMESLQEWIRPLFEKSQEKNEEKIQTTQKDVRAQVKELVIVPETMHENDSSTQEEAQNPLDNLKTDLKILQKLIRKNQATPQHIQDILTRVSQLDDQGDRDQLLVSLLRVVDKSLNSKIREFSEVIDNLLHAPESPSEEELHNTLLE
jgi:hypothetical protein